MMRGNHVLLVEHLRSLDPYWKGCVVSINQLLELAHLGDLMIMVLRPLRRGALLH